jgi:hypothetical protein
MRKRALSMCSLSVRAAFRAYAAGYGFKTIAHALSGHTTPLPSKVRSEFFSGKTALSPSGRKLWSGSSIRDWAHNARYHGEVTYGKYEWIEDEDPTTGKTVWSRRRQTDVNKLANRQRSAARHDPVRCAAADGARHRRPVCRGLRRAQPRTNQQP